MECTIENKKLIPLSRVVKSSIIDTYGDIGILEERYSHWATRELKQIYMQSLPKLTHKVLLEVNKNTHTATLPLDFDSETFIGGINEKWQKVPLRLNNNLVDSKNITDIPCEDACPKCQQDTGICNDLVVTEEINLIVINDTTYEQTIIKKLYPNGDYYLETTTPMLDIATNGVVYHTKKDFIVNFDLKPCGCLETTPANIVTLQNYCPDIYCRYYSDCGMPCNSTFGGYKIFEETGLIQFDVNFPYSKVYLEYNGFIQKIKGQYYVPEVAFETLVEGVKLRAIKNKKNVLRWQVIDQKNEYREAKGNMSKILGRASLTRISQSIMSLPKFDIDYNNYYSSYQNCFSQVTNTAAVAAACTNSGLSVTNTTTIINRTAYVLAVRTGDGVGNPVDGQSIYQNNVLKNATDIEFVFLAKQVLTKKDGDFTFDSVAGEINISPNVFVTGDSLIINYNK